MSMVEQFGKRLPRPVSVWVLDTLPGQVRAGSGPNRQDHPSDLIRRLKQVPMPLNTRQEARADPAAAAATIPAPAPVAATASCGGEDIGIFLGLSQLAVAG